VLSWLTEYVPSRPLGLTRIIVGSAAALRALVALPVLVELTQSDTLRLPYADFMPRPTIGLVIATIGVWIVSAVLFALGRGVAVTGPLLLAAIVFTISLDRQAYSNHLYLMAWLVLLLTVADSGASLTNRKGPQERPVVRWPVLLLMLQASIVYGFSALTKINGDFISGAVLAGVLRDGVIPFPDSLRNPGFLSALAVVVIAVELFIALFLWSPRFRGAAFILGLGLHVSIVLLISSTAELGVFALEMLALYPLFLSLEPVAVSLPRSTADIWRARIRRWNLLDRVTIAKEPADQLVAEQGGEVETGGAAHTSILENSVPWLWLAPLLRLPVVRQAHERAHLDNSELNATAGTPVQ
jgi:hypothetical protein